MKTIKTIIVAALAAMFSVAAFATAPTSATQFTPKLMNYQGYLADPSNGNPYADGIYQLECRLYRAATGGTAIWGGRYSVYVNKGYFNIMLGDSSATDLGYTYANTDIWRALWSDTGVTSSQRNDLWLGVTLLQGPTGATVSSPKEIMPRQQLLTAPYAFRAQASEYANQSYGNFAVNGNLTVSGSLSLPTSYSLQGITATSSNLKLAGTAYSTSNPTLYAYGSYMYLYPYYDLKIAPQAGNIDITVPSGKSLIVRNNSFTVNNATTTLNSSGQTDIYANNVVINSKTHLSGYATNNLRMESKSASAIVEGYSYAQLSSETGHVYLEPATNKSVIGMGTLTWAPPGKTTGSTYVPFQINSVEVTIPSGSSLVYYTLESNYNTSMWNYVMAGYYWRSGSQQGLSSAAVIQSDGGWKIYLRTPSNCSSATTYRVYYLRILKTVSAYN